MVEARRFSAVRKLDAIPDQLRWGITTTPEPEWERTVPKALYGRVLMPTEGAHGEFEAIGVRGDIAHQHGNLAGPDQSDFCGGGDRKHAGRWLPLD